MPVDYVPEEGRTLGECPVLYAGADALAPPETTDAVTDVLFIFSVPSE